ncbi:MAG: hypothetical protein ACPF8V_12075, partial [Luteibaculum sp.]
MRIPALIFILFALLLSSCSWIDCTDGKGEIKSKEFSGIDQPEVKVNIDADVHFVASSQAKVEVKTYENILELIEIEEDGG